MITTSSTKHVAAVAGRRIDPEPAEARRFPFEQVPKVERELHRLFEEIGDSILVTSAACGADLLALKVVNSNIGLRNVPTCPVIANEEISWQTSGASFRARIKKLIERAPRSEAAFGSTRTVGRSTGQLIKANEETNCDFMPRILEGQ